MTDGDSIAIDIATKMVELVITLGSAVIIGIITFHDTVTNAGVSFCTIQITVVLMGISIFAGLFSLANMSGIIMGSNDKSVNASNILYNNWVQYSALVSIGAYFLAMLVFGASVII